MDRYTRNRANCLHPNPNVEEWYRMQDDRRLKLFCSTPSSVVTQDFERKTVAYLRWEQGLLPCQVWGASRQGRHLRSQKQVLPGQSCYDLRHTFVSLPYPPTERTTQRGLARSQSMATMRLSEPKDVKPHALKKKTFEASIGCRDGRLHPLAAAEAEAETASDTQQQRAGEEAMAGDIHEGEAAEAFSSAQMKGKSEKKGSQKEIKKAAQEEEDFDGLASILAIKLDLLKGLERQLFVTRKEVRMLQMKLEAKDPAAAAAKKKNGSSSSRPATAN